MMLNKFVIHKTSAQLCEGFVSVIDAHGTITVSLSIHYLDEMRIPAEIISFATFDKKAQNVDLMIQSIHVAIEQEVQVICMCMGFRDWRFVKLLRLVLIG